MTYESPFRLPDFQFIDLSYGGRTLQMRPSQLTTVNIARAFRLIADTIILVSERDTVALPQDGVFHDVDDCYAWTVEGEKATTNIPSGAAASQRGKFPSTESRWKPQAFPPTLPSARAGTASSKHGNGNSPSWIKSVDICSFNSNNEVVAYSEYPVTMDENTANVPTLQEKLSKEAFGGSGVKLLNSKNILIADTEGTQGMKFWKTGKIVKAISEADYLKLQRSKGRNDPGPSKPLTVVLTDSDSDGPLIPLVRKKRKMFHVPPPPVGSDSDSSIPPVNATNSVEKMFAEVITKIRDLENKLDKATGNPGDKNALKEIFTCLICKQISTEASKPVIPPCCQSVICCFDCIQQWISSSPVCPHCRSPITIDSCLVQPLFKPMFELIEVDKE